MVESGSLADCDGVCVQYNFVAGSVDWTIIDGNRSGVSQHSFKSQLTNKRVVWNYPFEIAYSSFSVSGWPQIVLRLTERDWWGRDQVVGYGVTHVPTQPGCHQRYVNLFRPISSSMFSQFLGWFFGENAEYLR